MSAGDGEHEHHVGAARMLVQRRRPYRPLLHRLQFRSKQMHFDIRVYVTQCRCQFMLANAAALTASCSTGFSYMIVEDVRSRCELCAVSTGYAHNRCDPQSHLHALGNGTHMRPVLCVPLLDCTLDWRLQPTFSMRTATRSGLRTSMASRWLTVVMPRSSCDTCSF